VKYALGSLVLAKMRSNRGTPLQFGEAELQFLAEKDRDRLTQALSETPPAPSSGPAWAEPDGESCEGTPDPIV
jgi:hypothetical protein